MIPKELKALIDTHCMGKKDIGNIDSEILNLIMDKVGQLNANPDEVMKYMDEMIKGPTKEEREAAAKAEAERKAKEEAERKAKEEAKRKAEAERKAKEEAERKAKEEAERKAKEEAERKAKAEAERKAKEETREKLNNILKKFFLAICALLFPPIVVIACNGGCGSILLSFVLWSLGWIPGVLYAFIVLYKTMSNK